MGQNSKTNGKKTPEQIREHYEIEVELAKGLRNGSKKERGTLYASTYDELFQRVPFHTHLTNKASPRARLQAVRRQMKWIKPFLRAEAVFLEIGPGDCALSFEACRHAQKVYAIDVSDEITKSEKVPGNFHLILSDGRSIPVPAGSVDVAFSDQLMEHLHPDDAEEQLCNIYKTLAPGGVYICVTPNRLTGPHDISKHFDDVARGLHLKEYTFTELSTLFSQVGFKKIVFYLGGRGMYLRIPALPVLRVEKWLVGMRPSVRKAFAQNKLASIILKVHLVAIK